MPTELFYKKWLDWGHPTAIKLRVQGKLTDGQALIKLYSCNTPEKKYPTLLKWTVKEKIDTTFGYDWYMPTACIEYTPYGVTNGNLNISVSIR